MHVKPTDEHPSPILEEALDAYQHFACCLRRATHAAWLELDLSIAQLKGLLIAANLEAVHISELGHLLGIGRPAASLLVDKLYRLGLITRMEDPVDRRHSHVRLTGTGHDLIARLYLHDRHALSRWSACLEQADMAATAHGLRVLAGAMADPTCAGGSTARADRLPLPVARPPDRLPSTAIPARSAMPSGSRPRPRTWIAWSIRRAGRA